MVRRAHYAEFIMRPLRLLVVGLVLGVLSACATSDRPPSHPDYAAAITNLRVAREILNREAEYAIVRDQYRALEAIDRAVLELKVASIDSGQMLEPAPVLDPTLDYGGRLHRARELVMAADHELSFREDNAAARPARDNARQYVEDARDAINRAIRDRAGFDIRS
jgi:hypothetical protein